jgi:hypothetical protein
MYFEPVLGLNIPKRNVYDSGWMQVYEKLLIKIPLMITSLRSFLKILKLWM